MNTVFSFLKFVVIVNALVFLCLLIMLALPKSRLRAVFLTTVGWVFKATAAVCLLYVISPLDIVPDAVPVAGYLDDIVVGALGILSGIGAVGSSAAGRRESIWLKEHEYRVEECEETQ